MTRVILAALLLALTPLPALAAETPRAGLRDARIRTVDYDADEVVRIVGGLRTATQIRFGADETILHVAVGDTAAWDVAPEGGILFVKPTAVRPPTNLIVTTQVNGAGARHYTFELSARAAAVRGPDSVFVVQFRYPAEERQRVAAALDAEAAALDARILQLKLDRAVLRGPRNLAYELQGSRAIAPSEVSDNGTFTVLRFPGAQALPSVYQVTADGSEALVPFSVSGEFLVVHQTAAQLRLRQGRAALCVFNLAFRPAAVPATGTATAAPEVERTLRPELPR